MKFTWITMAVMATSAYGAVFPRQEQQQNDTSYPDSTDLSFLTGTWYSTGVSKNLADLLTSSLEKTGLAIGCEKYDFSEANKTTVQLVSSIWLTRGNKSAAITAAGEYVVAPPKQVNVSDNQVTLQVYLSQFYANRTAFADLYSSDNNDNANSGNGNGNGNGNSNNNGGGSGNDTTIVVPGTQAMSLMMNAKLIASNSDNHFDNVFYWFYDTLHQQNEEGHGRHSGGGSDSDSGSNGGSKSNLYASLMSNKASLSDDEYNHILSQLPQLDNTNWNETFTRTNETCN